MRSGNGQRYLLLLVGLLLIFVLQGVGGSSFRNLSNNAGASLFPDIAVSENTIYVVWDDDTLGNSEIFYVRSTDGGQTFSPPRNLSNNSGSSRNPAISVSGSDLYIVWDDETPGNFEIFFVMSRDGGQIFSKPQNLSQNAGRSVLPDIAASEGNIYVFWQDDTLGNPEIFYVRSPDGGQSFTAPHNLSQNPGNSWSPAVATEEKNVYVAWDDRTPGNREIFFARSSDGGASFSAPQNISKTPSFSAAPAIAASGNAIYIAWTEETPVENYEVFYIWSPDGGNTFAGPQNLSKSPTYSGAPALAASTHNIHLIWVEGLLMQKNGKPYVDYEVFYTTLARNGSAAEMNDFNSVPQNLSTTDEISVNPVVGLSADRIYVAWADYTPGNFEILFTRR